MLNNLIRKIINQALNAAIPTKEPVKDLNRAHPLKTIILLFIIGVSGKLTLQFII